MRPPPSTLPPTPMTLPFRPRIALRTPRASAARARTGLGRTGLVLAMLAAALCALPAALAAQAPTTVVLVRHAEPQPDGTSDPPLGPEGRQRAERLLAALRDAGVRAVYSTQLRRARETAEAVADGLGVSLVIEEARGASISGYPARLLERIRSERAGETVLVVGHSNTVPQMVASALGRPAPTTAELPHDAIFVLSLNGDSASVLRLRF